MRSSFLPPASRGDIRRGILYMVGAVFVFSILNAAIKWQVERYPVGEVVFIRCLFALIPSFVLVAVSGGLRVLRTRRLGWHVSRAMLQFVSMSCNFLAFSMMPLADAVAIGFASPIFLTALSVPLLGEKVGIYRWGAVAFGFLGVLIMVRPTGDVLNSGALFALANALFGALLSIGIRRLSATEASATLVFYQAVTTFLISAASLPFFAWVPPTWTDFLAIGAIGVCSGIAQFWWAQAFRFTPAAILAPFSYLSMIWAVLMGYFVWGDVPTLPLIAGAAIVAMSGLFIAHRETRRRGAATQPAKPAS
ncbi:DMT family transporter [Stella sp.]|uniref:DMT family transporter n=1 Tax=Stella sp. TaxID=2912054 RepID=UPI0035AF9D3D